MSIRSLLGRFAVTAILALPCCSGPTQPIDQTKTRIPISGDELRRRVPGHFIDEGTYACDAGPLMFYRDGKFVHASGWDDIEGEYVISDGTITLYGYPIGRPVILTFLKDGNGKMYYRPREGSRIERKLNLAKIDVDTRWITCGNFKAPPPPPNP